MGEIPAKTNMVSSVIINPPTGGDPIPSGQTFDIEVKVSNLEAGFFTNAAATYYSAPQALKNGKVIGHTHVTVQDLGNSLNPSRPLPPQTFAFFKGINDAGDGNGLLKATVTGGLPAGNYRVCTMTAARNHQPVLMPVAQRGTPDDCTKFKVGGNSNEENPAASDGDKGKAAASLAQSAVDAGPAATAPAAAASSTSAAKGNTGTGKGGNGDRGGRGSKGASSATSSAPANQSSTASKGGRGRQRPKRDLIL